MTNIVRNDKNAMKNVRALLSKRKNSRMSVAMLSDEAGLSYGAIQSYERGTSVPSPDAYNALADVFGWEKIEKPAPKKKKRRPPQISDNDKRPQKRSYEAVVHEEEKPLEIPKAPEFTFEQGRDYSIYAKDGNLERSSFGEKFYVFRYKGKQGIHHVFTEIHGGWSRTYTDVQLMGKTIKEV